jgi:transposase-like protein
LPDHWRVLYLDGIDLEVRHGEQVDPTIILAVMGVDLEGNKEMLAIRACAIDQSRGLAVCVTRSTHTWGQRRGSDRDRRT